MSKNPCDLLKEALVIIGSAAPYTWNAKDSAAWSERAAAFVKAHRDIKPLDGEWQSERPTEGKWWCAIAPERRHGHPLAVWLFNVYGDEVEWDGVRISMVNNPWFTGALWQRRTVPGDPFKAGE